MAPSEYNARAPASAAVWVHRTLGEPKFKIPISFPRLRRPNPLRASRMN